MIIQTKFSRRKKYQIMILWSQKINTIIMDCLTLKNSESDLLEKHLIIMGFIQGKKIRM